MWKSVVCFAMVLGCSSAGTAAWSEDISVHNNHVVTGIHYSQHESSVQAARKAAAERLQLQQAAPVVASGPCDTICYNSYTADAGDTETIGQGTVGFAPTVGSSQKYSSTSSRLESSVSNVQAAPIVYSGSSTGARSSFSSSSASRHHSSSLNGVAGNQPVLAQLYSPSVDSFGRTHSNVIATSGNREGTYVQPIVYPVPAPQTHASQTSYNERSSQERSVVSRPVVANVVYSAVPVGGASHSSSNFNTRSSFTAADQQQHVQPVYPTANNDYSRQYVASQHQDHHYRQYPSKSTTYVVYSKPQYYASGHSRVQDAASSQTTYDSAGRVVNLNLVQPTVHTDRVDDHRTQQRIDSTQTVQRQQDLYPVRGGYDHQEHDTQDNLEIDAESNNTVQAYSSDSVATARRREQAGSVRTGTSYVSNAGSTNRYDTTAQSSDSQRRVVHHRTPEYVPTVTGSKYESASEQEQRHVTSHAGNSFVAPIVVQPVPQANTASRYSSSSSSSAQEHRASASPGSYYTVSGSVPSYASQYSNSAHSNSRYKAQQGGGHVYPITNDEMGRRFGATDGAGGFGADTDLHDIMSESETLARLQAQNVHNGAVTGSATIEMDSRFGGGSDANSLGTMPGGFQRTKSWSSSSKWALEQRYGDDGKPKSYSMLSTAESEKHNINGKTTGYKAATTTLEDDGKVSTYSLHTT